MARRGTITAEEQIANSDSVIALGRSALEAMAAARAALVLGPLGADGWVTPINYSQLEGGGFVGQATARILDRATLVSELSSWEPAMGNYNRDLVGELDQAHQREHQLREELDRERVRIRALLGTRASGAR